MKRASKAPGGGAGSSNTINRRQFLWLSLGIGGSLLAAPGFVQRTPPGEAQSHLLLSRLTGLLAHQESAQVIGAAYLQQYPQESAANRLLNQLVASIGGVDAITRQATTQDLRTLVQQRVEQDFADESIVKIQGWILSQTEARLCALATLV